jgi:signal transduction histidine kinase
MLFEPYTVVEHRARTGSGLGLYIAKGIVVQHGGRIWAASDVGKGSIFCFTLPRAI